MGSFSGTKLRLLLFDSFVFFFGVRGGNMFRVRRR